MNSRQKKNLVYRIIEFGEYKARNNIIVKRELIANADVTDLELLYIERYLEHNGVGEPLPHHIITLTHAGPSNDRYDWQYRVLPNAIFQYNDYLEIKAARETAIESRRLSWIAIIITLVLGVLQICFQVTSKC